MLALWTLLLVQAQPSDTTEPRRGVNRLLGLPCGRLDLDCLQTSLRQWYADPYRFWMRMRVVVDDHPERSVPPLFGMRFGEGAQTARPAGDATDVLMARAAAIWGDDSISIVERRQRVFQLWDECDEDTPAGREARARIVRFIRELAPRGSPRAYPRAELRELNQHRRSEKPFAPYE